VRRGLKRKEIAVINEWSEKRSVWGEDYKEEEGEVEYTFRITWWVNTIYVS